MKLICINCPRGCHLEAEQDGDKIKVTGNACPRGYTYAYNEMTHPLRTLTSTVEVESKDQRRLPVISSSPLPKGRIMDVMKELKGVKTKAPVKMGDVIVADVLGLGVDIIASKSIVK
ncbi:MAG: DUF1667 domain-containing protein [Erysipelotrichaceae bacterium]|nr:DUF1667 domain-containing protein [Erysipelotrichaceae bacterium]